MNRIVMLRMVIGHRSEIYFVVMQAHRRLERVGLKSGVAGR